MSDVMLHGVLCMPPELWRGDFIDIQQRYGRYLEASERINEDERLINKLKKESEQARSSREMLVARLGNMDKNGDKWLTVVAVIALLNDCDMISGREI